MGVSRTQSQNISLMDLRDFAQVRMALQGSAKQFSKTYFVLSANFVWGENSRIRCIDLHNPERSSFSWIQMLALYRLLPSFHLYQGPFIYDAKLKRDFLKYYRSQYIHEFFGVGLSQQKI